MKKSLLGLCLTILTVFSFGQGLEDIIVERYYVSDANDATDEDGGSLPEGSVTYRIFVDMLPGYNFQAVYGNDNHTLRIATTTEFFNNEDRGEQTGESIGDNRVDENTVAVDSWISVGGATDEHLGVLKSEDPDGSIVGGANNDGGSEGIAEGLLANEDPSAGIPLTTADGLVEGAPVEVTAVGDLDLSMFADENDGTALVTNGGSWAALGGAQGATESNMVLIAQITTDGELSFELNVQIGTPDGGVERYVASNPIDEEILFPALTFPRTAVVGCTDDAACNFNPEATEDDGTCVFVQDPECEECRDGAVVVVDDNGNGIADCREVPGCTDDAACNFDPNANVDDNSCVFVQDPECEECRDGAVVVVDDNGNGIADCREVPGCTDDAACNFDPNANVDDNSCVFVQDPQCEECRDGAVVAIDNNNNGIADCDEMPGCTDDAACNFDPNANVDDNSCVFVQDPECEECRDGAVVVVDDNNNGIADCREVPGCTDDAACNFDANANVDDNSCVFVQDPECEECRDGAVVIIDNNNNGIADCEEEGGCTDETACNFDPNANVDNGSCVFVQDPECEECRDGAVVVVDDNNNGIADCREVPGCTDDAACNFDANANVDDNSCVFVQDPECEECRDGAVVVVDDNNNGIADCREVPGCTDDAACNFDANANVDDNSCVFVQDPECEECRDGAVVIIDNNNNGIADCEEEGGCTDETACNFDPNANVDNGSCVFVQDPECEECRDGAVVVVDDNNNGIADCREVPGCTDDAACNFDANANVDDNSCVFVQDPECEECRDGAVVIIDNNNNGIADCEEEGGCTDETACNFDPNANVDNGSCVFVQDPECEECRDGAVVVVDDNNNGIADCREVPGCTDDAACNFDANANVDDNSCVFVQDPECEECRDGAVVIIDNNNNGIADCEEEGGCTDETACNFDPNANVDNGSCVFVQDPECEECKDGAVVIIDNNGNGIADCKEVPGCTDDAACNFDPNANVDNGSCVFVQDPECEECKDGAVVIIDNNGNGIADCKEVPGCTDDAACNFDPNANVDDNSCVFVTDPECEECKDGAVVIIDNNGNGIADCKEVPGCTDDAACNFDPNANVDNGSCVFVQDPECEECKDGAVVIIDNNGNGIADCKEVPGCTDDAACNFDPNANVDDNSCVFVTDPECEECKDGAVVIIDNNGNGIADCKEVPGCTDDAACNFDPNANVDNGSCVFVQDPECEECKDGAVVAIDENGNGIPDCDEPGDCSNSTLAVDAGPDQVVYPAYIFDDCDILAATSTGGAGAVSYLWSTGETTASINVCPAVSTTYTVTATDEDGCTASDMVDVCAKDIACRNGRVLVCWTYTYRGRIYSQYTYCVSPYVAYLLTNFYNSGRSVWTLGSCGDTGCDNSSAKAVNGDFGSEDFLTDDEYALIYGETSLDIHPNPTVGQDVTIDIENIRTSNGEVEISVVDQLGKTVHAQVTELYNGTGSVELALDEDLPAGSYIVLIKTSSTVISEQLVVQ